MKTAFCFLLASSACFGAMIAGALAQDGAAPVVVTPPGTTESITGALPTLGPAGARADADVAHTRQLVRTVNQNTDNIKSSGDFGAQLWIVEGRRFFDEWKKPGPPAINPVEAAPRGQTVFTAIVFYGMQHDGGGLSNVTYTLVVKRPDGTVYDKRDDAIGWQDLAPTDDRQVLLGRDSLGVTISPQDPPGLYTVEATVRDNVSRVELPLVQHFVVR